MTVLDDMEHSEAWDAQAAEYVLGLLDEAERAAFEAQLLSDADLGQDVTAWQTYFAAFAETLEAVPPPPQLYRRIEAEAFGGTRRKSYWQSLWPYAAGAVVASVLTFAAYSFDLLALTPLP